MRVVLFCNDDLTTNLIFSPIFNVKGVDVVGVFFMSSPNRKHQTPFFGAVSLLNQMSKLYWLYLVGTNVLYKLFDLITSVFNLTPKSGVLVSLRRLAKLRRIPCESIRDFSDPYFIQRLRKMEVDLLIIRVGVILKSNLLECMSIGTWCVHSSLLPSFKGIAGEFHALRHSSAPIGTTVFDVTSKLDEGPPVAQITIMRRESSSVYDHMIRNNIAAGKLLVSLLEDRLYGRMGNYLKPDEGLKPSYFGWPQPHHLRQARKLGIRLIFLREWFSLLISTLRFKSYF